MSALAMILTAAMTVPASGPEMATWEMEQRLDLGGEWEGAFYDLDREPCRVSLKGTELKVSLKGGKLVTHEFEYIDGGKGTVNIMIAAGGVVTFAYRGIYKYHGDQVFICFSSPGRSAPTSYRAGSNQSLLILRRVKPRK